MQLRFSDEPTRPLDLPALDAPGVHCWRDDDGSLIAYGYQQGGSHWMSWPSFATFRFSRDSGHVTAYPDPSVPPAAIESVFARSVLPLALQALGHESMHASAVVHPA